MLKFKNSQYSTYLLKFTSRNVSNRLENVLLGLHVKRENNLRFYHFSIENIENLSFVYICLII